MFDADWTEEVKAHAETAVAHEAFERSVEDIDRLGEELDVEVGEYRDPRLGDVEHCIGFDRYTVTVDADAVDEFNEAVRKLNIITKRHDGEVRVVSERKIEMPHPWMKVKVWQDGKRVTVPVILRQTIFTVEAPAVAGEKTKLVGSFEVAENGEDVYMNAVPGYSADDMKPFLARWQDCDHCGKVRQRLASFVCEREDGARVVIGRQCSKAYLGLSPADLLARAAVAKTLNGAGDLDEDEGAGFFGRSSGLHVATVMERAYRVAKHFHGYSKLIREEFLDHMRALNGAKDERGSYTNENIRRMYAAKPPLEPMDLNAFADWLCEGKAKGDEFVSKLHIAFSSEYVKEKRFMLIVAGVGIFVGRAIEAAKRAQMEKEAHQGQPAPKHAGAAEGQRFEVVGRITRTHPYQTDWTAGLIIAIRCADGTNLLHFCKGEKVPDLGDLVKVRATVKRHEKDKKSGDPVTVITRAIYTVQKEEA